MPPAAMQQQRASAPAGPSKPPQVSVTDSSLSKLGASSTVSCAGCLRARARGDPFVDLAPFAAPIHARRPRRPSAQLFKIEVLLPQQPNAQDVRGCARARAHACNPRGAR